MTTPEAVGLGSLLVLFLAICVAEYAYIQIEAHAKWKRFFQTGSIRRM
jgi:hypothetical protein